MNYPYKTGGGIIPEGDINRPEKADIHKYDPVYDD